MAYVPILKGKQGELKALSELAKKDKTDIMPLIEIPPVASKWNEGDVDPVPAKTIDEHVKGLADSIQKAWDMDTPVFIDPLWIEDEDFLLNGDEASLLVYSEANKAGLVVIPTIRLNSFDDCIRSAVSASKTHGEGICIRLTSNDLADMPKLTGQINALLEEHNLIPSDIHLILDYHSISPEMESVLRAAVPAQLAALPHVSSWKSLTIAASTAPENLTGVSQNSVAEYDRTEWMLYAWLHNRRGTLVRMPQYGDYAVAHPEILEIDPRIMRMSPNIRYTGQLIWVIAKGEAYKRKKDIKKSIPGSVQYPRLCTAIIQHQEWAGAQFSWGDTYIEDCSQGNGGPGNATTWRGVGTNHHLTLVVGQLASLPSP